MSLSLNESRKISNKKIYDGLQNMINSNLFLRYIGNSRDNFVNVNGRFKMAEDLWKEISRD